MITDYDVFCLWNNVLAMAMLYRRLQGVHKVSLQFKKIIKKWNDEISLNATDLSEGKKKIKRLLKKI